MACPTLLRAFLRYEPESGKLYWKPRARAFFKTDRACSTWNKRYAGKEALAFRDNYGYRIGALGDMRHLKAHRAAWAIVHGAWPKEHIDHINGKRDDNRLENLREASHEENQRNLKMNRNNKSGHIGVFWLATIGKWWAYIGCGPTRRTLGYFTDWHDAVAARKAAQDAAGYSPIHGMTENERLSHATS